jgi:DNA polymerase-3 subunit gamma/tau
MSQALYRKYRSKTLGEVVGQSHVTDILERGLKNDRIAHAYLLTGPRGVGKTSIARILAHEINKLPYDDESSHLDIIEIDAASNNGVEDVRDLREKVQIAPVSAKRKIYIIDEVHMLSKAAFNALLKTLEEPPEHAVFILATTDIDKLPPTIISRTQRFHFRSIGLNDLFTHLKHIAEQEKIKIDDDALKLIALRGDGSFRDAISLLDQISNLASKDEGITADLIEKSLGLAPHEHVAKLIKAYEAKDLETIVALLDESDSQGVQPTVLTTQLIQAIRETIATKPQLLELLDSLLEVPKSSQPSIKLLTTLALHAAPKPRSAALIAPPLEVSASVDELRKQEAVSPIGEKQSVSTAKPRKESPEAAPVRKDMSNNSEATIKNEHIQTGNVVGELDWPKLIEYTRQHYVAVFSVLSKCTPEFDGQKLLLYTGNAFYKKKLDDSKHRINLSKSLVETGVGEPFIETIGTPPPPKDGVAASVAAIMGGGEEVTVEA